MNLPKVLHLTLQKQWFDQILSGIKTTEYREYKKYWIDRLQEKDGSFKNFNVIQFKNGYNLDAPFMVVELNEIRIKSISWFRKEKRFELLLGKVLEKGNLKEELSHP